MSDAIMIIVKKVIEGKNGVIEVSPELVCVNEIKFLRPWRKSENQKMQVNGDMSVLAIAAASGKGFCTILINEGTEAFAKRLGPKMIIPLDEELRKQE